MLNEALVTGVGGVNWHLARLELIGHLQNPPVCRRGTVAAKPDVPHISAFLGVFHYLENTAALASVNVVGRFDCMHLPKIEMIGPESAQRSFQIASCVRRVPR